MSKVKEAIRVDLDTPSGVFNLLDFLDRSDSEGMVIDGVKVQNGSFVWRDRQGNLHHNPPQPA